WMRSSYTLLFPAPTNLHEFKKFADTRLRQLKQHALTPHLLAVSGADLSHVQPHVSRVFAEYNRTYDDVEFVISTPSDYFRRVKGLADFPTWQGDLNPVFQGTYSARIAIKQWNRRMETLLAEAEWLDALSTLLGQASSRARLAEAWEGVLFNQFHDIICGSQVDKVYANVIDRYKASHETTSRCRGTALEAVIDEIDTSGEGVPVVVFNPLNWERTDALECHVGFSEHDVYEVEVRSSTGERVPHDLLRVERYETGGIKRVTLLFIARNVPALGYEVYRVLREEGEPEASTLSSNQPEVFMADVHRDVLENEFFRVELDAWNGAIRSLIDKTTGWEVIPAERPYGNTVVRELDNGNFWEYNGHCKGDAFHPMNRDHPLPEENSNRATFSHHYGGDARVRNGAARIEYNVNFAFAGGYFATRVRLYAGVPRVDIQTTLINQAERVRYRMALPTTLAEGTITQEIPFGALERPSGEFPAQNWMDYGDGGKGIALLNRGLPGNNVDRGVLLLSLLKCTSLAEGYGEVGGFSKSTRTSDGYELGVTHTFDYALAPHAGDWREAQVYRRGQEFNRPLFCAKAVARRGRLAPRLSLFTLSAENVVVTAVKAGDDGVVVRLYEAEGRPTEAVTLTAAVEIRAVTETDLIEKPQDAHRVDGNGRSFTFSLGAFEIRTFRLLLEPW
ncbi:MAG TPA: glycoside hydrolase family 38 C-terminal domain-containing protein, partial [Armatimonadota bacterium]|nr:glycoside hydrolase family 38 C-terminal domain-containing protein [Armatimonadota bacterium]